HELTAARARPFDSALKTAADFLAGAEAATLKISKHASDLIADGAIVLTHSRSSNVLSSLLESKRRAVSFSVVATESRPLLEGRTLAEQLASSGVPVTLIADAAAAASLAGVRLVLVGADRVTPSDVANKIGTRMIALAARDQNIPIYALCDRTKFISSRI